MKNKLAIPVALAAAVLTFPVVLWLLSLSIVSIVLAAVAATVMACGVYYMIDDRSDEQVALDNSREKADAKCRDALDQVRVLRQLSEDVQDDAGRQALLNGCQNVPVFLQLVRDTSPGNLFIVASDVIIYLSNLQNLVGDYLRIEPRSERLSDGQQQLEKGQAAFLEFAGFVDQNIQQLRTPSTTSYELNLQMVQRPELPQLGKE